MASLQLLAIKPKTWRDLVSDEPFTREDIITIQDPANVKARDARDFDYVKNQKKVSRELATVWIKLTGRRGHG
jgi:peptidyl-prolyl cis-trans isomerase-like protein 2